MLDEQPAAPALARRDITAVTRPHQHPGSLQLVPVERELQITLPQRRILIVDLRLPRPVIPEHDDPGAVAFRDDAFEAAVLEGMILHMHRQPLGRRIEGWPLGHSPRPQHAVVLEAEVVVKPRGQVLLNAEASCRPARRRATGLIPRRLGRFREIALAPVVVEGHQGVAVSTQLSGPDAQGLVRHDIKSRCLETPGIRRPGPGTFFSVAEPLPRPS